MKKIALPAVLAVLLQAAPLAHADERIRGTVIDTRVTYCESGRPSSCKGTLQLLRDAAGWRETLTIDVPLGTPISRGCQAVPLHRLGGQTVIVTEDAASGARVARAIEAVESTDGAC